MQVFLPRFLSLGADLLRKFIKSQNHQFGLKWIKPARECWGKIESHDTPYFLKCSVKLKLKKMAWMSVALHQIKNIT